MITVFEIGKEYYLINYSCLHEEFKFIKVKYRKFDIDNNDHVIHNFESKRGNRYHLKNNDQHDTIDGAYLIVDNYITALNVVQKGFLKMAIRRERYRKGITGQEQAI